ncbi:hypothetical protein PUN28_015555 [Cardiocondyla obscurior]|uniref:Uncharacterized protein n=1 Tax=Cardiocondyla obscurior TaxID=286306 RepID=A0AAW2EUT9_9HYME
MFIEGTAHIVDRGRVNPANLKIVTGL